METTTRDSPVTTPAPTGKTNFTTPKSVLYTAKLHTIGGRDGGTSHSSDGRLDVKLSLPGSEGDGTNPEQLFAAGWSSCFMSAMKLAAGKMKMRFPPDAFVDAEVDLCLDDNDRHFLQARLNISLPGVKPEVARALADAGDQLCPYSRATRGNVAITINLV